jgi:hypothetical protein
LCVEWKYATTSWDRLADLKESNPVEVAEYAVANRFLMPLLLCGGIHISSRSAVELLPL